MSWRLAADWDVYILFHMKAGVTTSRYNSQKTLLLFELEFNYDYVKRTNGYYRITNWIQINDLIECI